MNPEHDGVHQTDVAHVSTVLVALAAGTARAEANDAAPPNATLEAIGDTPLTRLATRARLDEVEVLVLRLLAAASLDVAAHRALLRLCTDPTRPGIGCDGLAVAIDMLGGDSRAALAALEPAAPLTAHGLVVLEGSGPTPGRRAMLPPRVVAVIRDGEVPADAFDSPLVARQPIAAEQLCELDDRDRDGTTVAARLRELLPEVIAGRAPWLVGDRGVGRRTLLATVAAEHGLALLCVDASECAALRPAELAMLLHREALLVPGLICIRATAARGEAREPSWPALYDRLRRARVPVVWISEDPPVLADFDQPPLLVRVSNADAEARAKLWRTSLPRGSDELARELAVRYALTPSRIVRAAGAARELAAARREPLGLDHVARAMSALVAQQVSVLGTQVATQQTWDDVVLPEETLAGVREMISRVRSRYRVLEDWGFRRKLSKGLGLAALFYGPPGSGKTMVASLLAHELGLELYQIDLARITSKWIGETEKNLARVFDAAEGANVLLLFDEADSLFSKRTGDVKSATDRYANAEVNYLLQRIERFEGISILTTNIEGSIDPAFKRRLAFRIQFPIPEAHDRAELWRRMLPAEAETAGILDFDELAEEFEISGGHIKNAVLRAAYFAAGEGRAIAMSDLTRAVKLEYRDAGKLSAAGRID